MIKLASSLLSPSGSNARLTILILHGVKPAPDLMFPGNTHAQQFDAMLGWIGAWFNVMPLPDAVAAMAAGCLPARALAITFDDGYEDNHSVAMPILQRHGMSATFYVSSSFLNGGCMWNDVVIESVRRSDKSEIDCGRFGRHTLKGWAARAQAAEALIGQIKYLDFDARLDAVAEVAKACSVVPPTDLMMRDEQVLGLHRAGMTIGAHTCRHPILARISDEAVRAEIADGRAALESIIGARVGLFAYPNGRPNEDYRAEHVAIVRELGFDAAVSTARGASAMGDDPFQLRRCMPWDQTRMRFGARLVQNLVQHTPTPLVASS